MAEPKFLENFDPPTDVAEAPPPVVAPAPETKTAPVEAVKPVEPVVEAEKVAEPKEGGETAAYKAAMLDERQKRQKLEQDIAYLRGKTEAARNPQDDEAKKKKDALDLENRFLTDPVGFTEGLLQERIADAVLHDRWARSVYSVEREHKDWPAERDAFLKLVSVEPHLEARANSHPDPARFAYEYMKQRRAPATVADLEAERKKIREEERALARKEAALSDASSISPTLAGANGSGGGGSVVKDHDVNDLFVDKSF